MSISSEQNESALKRKVELIENAIEALDGEDRAVIQKVFFDRVSIEEAAGLLSYARSTMFYRVKKLLTTIADLVNDCV
jgi:DNA-directed RNA polymerase specialized sigma24 family protein